MGELNASSRKKLPKGSFAVPPKGGKPGAYPIHDKAHAVAALARVAANGTPAEKAKVRAAVKAKYPSLPSSKGDTGSATGRANKAKGSAKKPTSRARKAGK